jgi:hypothetical protein
MSTWSPPWSEQTSLFDLNDQPDGTRVWLLDEVVPSRGASWTPDTSEWPSGADGYSPSSLSEILQRIEPDAPYWLSPRACQGIIRRATRRGKELPPALRAALSERASQAPPAPEDEDEDEPISSQED